MGDRIISILQILEGDPDITASRLCHINTLLKNQRLFGTASAFAKAGLNQSYLVSVLRPLAKSKPKKRFQQFLKVAEKRDRTVVPRISFVTLLMNECHTTCLPIRWTYPRLQTLVQNKKHPFQTICIQSLERFVWDIIHSSRLVVCDTPRFSAPAPPPCLRPCAGRGH